MQIKRVILILIIFLLDSCSSKPKLPILSKYINDDGLEVIYKINDLNFTDQNNQTFNENQLNNTIYIANFFFTRCPSICPKMKFVLEDIANAFKKDSNFKIISISIDPKNDTPSVLKPYSNATGIANNKWLFLTGEKKELEKTAKLFRTSFSQEDEIDFYHSSFVALVDKEQLIRGFYDLLKPISVVRLKKDIRQLLK